jgi:HAD superfamily hydrolase (TIGR01509 family)
MALEAVLLDIDGTLLDSNDAHARAWVEAFQADGYDVPWEAVRPLIGMGGDQLVRTILGLEKEDPRSQALAERRKELFLTKELPGLRPFPGARELVARMRASGLRLIVATSASQEDLDALLERVGIAELIDGATNADDVDASKPEPDIVECALAKAGCAADAAALLGDTPWDLAAARRAGVAMVAVRCGGWEDAELVGAAAIYDDPADLLRRFNRSIFAPGVGARR